MKKLNSVYSSRNLAGLDKPSILYDLSVSLSVLSIILESEPGLRFFSWFPQQGSHISYLYMSDDQGEDAILVFGEQEQTLFFGLGHESTLSQVDNLLVQMRGSLPPQLTSLYDFAVEKIGNAGSFCIWYDQQYQSWKSANTDFPFRPNDKKKQGFITCDDYPWFIDYIDGSAYFLKFFDGLPQTFKEEADENFYLPDVVEEFDLEVIKQIYMHHPITEEMAKKLNPGCIWPKIQKEIKDIGYPIR